MRDHCAYWTVWKEDQWIERVVIGVIDCDEVWMRMNDQLINFISCIVLYQGLTLCPYLTTG